MKCSRCPGDYPRAALTVVGDQLVCPACLYAEHDHAIKHAKPADRKE